jgi:hypothetical protein
MPAMPVVSARRHRRTPLTASVLLTALGATAVLPVATAAATAAAAPAAAEATADARYAGKAVAIGKDLVAVLRDDPGAGGPEAWIRAVPPHWRSGDAYLYRVLDKLDRGHPAAVQRGLSLRLAGAGGSAPELRVTGAGGGEHSYPLPKAGTPTPGAAPSSRRTSSGPGWSPC